MDVRTLFPVEKRLVGIFTTNRAWLPYANTLGVQAIMGDEDLPRDSFHLVLPGPNKERSDIARIFPNVPDWINTIPSNNVITINSADEMNDLLSTIEPSSNKFKSHLFLFDEFHSIMDKIGTKARQIEPVFKTIQASTRHANKFMMTNVSSILAADKRYYDHLCEITSFHDTTIVARIGENRAQYELTWVSNLSRFEDISRKVNVKTLIMLIDEIARRLSKRSPSGNFLKVDLVSEIIAAGYTCDDVEGILDRGCSVIKNRDGTYRHNPNAAMM